MASRFPKTLSKIAGIILAVVAGVMLLLQIVLNTPMVRRMVDKAVAQNVDADLQYSKLHFSFFKAFPRLRVTLRDLSLTYPHDRFAAYDSAAVKSRLLNAGRGEAADTLLRFKEFSAAVNVWRIFGGKIRLAEAHLDGLGVFAHAYDTTANWDIFGPSAPKDSVSKPLNLPWISVGKVSIGDKPRVVYTDQADTLFAAIRFDDFRLGGNVKIGKVLKMRGISLGLDSLRVHGRLPSDTLAFALDSLGVGQEQKVFDLGLKARALLRSLAFGRMRVPVEIFSKVGFDQDKERTKIDLKSFNADIAHIPLEAEGLAEMFPDSTFLRLKAGINDCNLQEILREYLDGIVETAKEIDTDALLSVGLLAEGSLAGDKIPVVDASVRIPKCRLTYHPMDLDGTVALDCAAHASEDKVIDVDLREADIDIPGLDLDLSGRGEDVVGGNPFLSAKGYVDANLGRIMRYLPKDLGVHANGRVRLDMDGRATLAQLKEYTADLNAKLVSDTLTVFMDGGLTVAAKDLAARLDNSTETIEGASGFHPLEGHVDFGKLRLRTDSLAVSVRRMKNTLRIAKSEYRGRPTPKLSVSSDNSRVFLRASDNRAAFKDMKIEAALTRRRRPSVRQRKRVLDSLQRVYPGVPRDSLFKVARRSRRNDAELPVYLQERSWRSQDINIALDSSMTRYLRVWSPSGNISVGGGIVAVPFLPLRNTVDGLDAGFTDNEINILRMDIRSGTSDVSATGTVSGLRRALMRHGMLKADLGVKSSRINVNELLAALQAGKTISVEAEEDTDAEAYMGSFAADSLSDAKVDTEEIGLIVVPANIDATFDMDVKRVDYADLDISSFKTTAVMKERCVQITNAEVVSDAGDIHLDAFYSTKTKQDISAGFNLNLSDISADRIIGLVPTVDDMMPALKSFKGNLNCTLTATSQLDTNMNLIIPSLDGVIRIAGKDLKVEDAGDLRRITRLLLFKNKNIGRIEDLDVNGFIHDGRVEVFPFIIGVDRYRLALCGMQGFDKQLNYHVSILKTPLPIRFGINMYGNLDKWRFSLGRAKYRDGKVPVFTEQIDTMQINIVKSIRQIYRKGVRAALRESGKSVGHVEDYKKSIGYRTPDGNEDLLTTAEYCQIDSLQFEMEIAEMDEAIMAEVEQILDETFVSAEALSREFDKMFFDKRLLRQQERAARRDARAAEKAAKKAAKANKKK